MRLTDSQPTPPKRATSSHAPFKIDQSPRMPARGGERTPPRRASEPMTWKTLLEANGLLQATSSDRWSANLTSSELSASSQHKWGYVSTPAEYFSKQDSNISDISASEDFSASSCSALDFADRNNQAPAEQPKPRPVLRSDHGPGRHRSVDDIFTTMMNGHSLRTMAAKWNQ
jgi:hypothetical protein